MKILAIDTSCDETSVAVTEGTRVLSNIIWSQASLHAKWGGVVPSLAQREHEKRIDWVVEKALKKAFSGLRSTDYGLQKNIDAVAVTVGPGLAIALGVGINKAKELAKKYKLPIILINHVEGHLLSAFAESRNSKLQFYKSQTTKKDVLKFKDMFPAIGVVASGGTTQVILIKKIGTYKIIANTMDDALGEALDKGARTLGLGYPGGAILERIAKEGKYDFSLFPIPMLGREKILKFSYSGLKTALVRKLDELKKTNSLNKETVHNIACSYQETAFKHFIRITQKAINKASETNHLKSIFVGGGVGANVLFRKKLRILAKENNLKIYFPYSKRLYTDNAVMIGVTAYLKNYKLKIKNYKFSNIDRKPNLKLS